MMVSTPEEATESTSIKVYDEIGPLSIEGWQIANLSWSYADAKRKRYSQWTNITLYGVANDPSMKYAIQITGRSSLYHRVGGSCSRGVAVPVGKLADDEERYEFLEACGFCKPEDLNHLKNTDTVKVEVDLHKLYRCLDANAVVATMYSHKRREDNAPSGLSVRLLTTAATLDPAIDEAIMNTPRT